MRDSVSREDEPGGAGVIVAAPPRIFMGLGWEMSGPDGPGGAGGHPAPSPLLPSLFGGRHDDELDLDASCLVFGDDRSLLDQVWFRQSRSTDGAIIHSGDNMTGEGTGDRESIRVDLGRIAPPAASIVFAVSSFHGQPLGEIAGAFCRIADGDTNAVLLHFPLAELGAHTGFVPALVRRQDRVWKLHGVGEKSYGKTFHDMMPAIRALL